MCDTSVDIEKNRATRKLFRISKPHTTRAISKPLLTYFQQPRFGKLLKNPVNKLPTMFRKGVDNLGTELLTYQKNTRTTFTPNGKNTRENKTPKNRSTENSHTTHVRVHTKTPGATFTRNIRPKNFCPHQKNLPQRDETEKDLPQRNWRHPSLATAFQQPLVLNIWVLTRHLTKDGDTRKEPRWRKNHFHKEKLTRYEKPQLSPSSENGCLHPAPSSHRRKTRRTTTFTRLRTHKNTVRETRKKKTLSTPFQQPDTLREEFPVDRFSTTMFTAKIMLTDFLNTLVDRLSTHFL